VIVGRSISQVITRQSVRRPPRAKPDQLRAIWRRLRPEAG